MAQRRGPTEIPRANLGPRRQAFILAHDGAAGKSAGQATRARPGPSANSITSSLTGLAAAWSWYASVRRNRVVRVRRRAHRATAVGCPGGQSSLLFLVWLRSSVISHQPSSIPFFGSGRIHKASDPDNSSRVRTTMMIRICPLAASSNSGQVVCWNPPHLISNIT